MDLVLLEPDRLVPLDGLIGDLSRSETKNQEKPLDKARAIYKYVLSTMRYDKTGEGWGKGDAIFACNAKRGNCTDFHALFIGMMRAAGIPARFEIGFPLPRDKNAAEIGGYHCWAQFWVDGLGWVPVDASEAWKDASRRDYFFGAHDANRILFSRGRDIHLDPPQEGNPLNCFVYPYAELDGKPWIGLQSTFSFRDLSSS
jgi:transglutaminase-like putative cysteine protease